jgi:hypothetical protein
MTAWSKIIKKEEGDYNATFCEFVKLWGNGSQAHLQVNCLGGQAWVQLMSALGPPSSTNLFGQHNWYLLQPKQKFDILTINLDILTIT